MVKLSQNFSLNEFKVSSDHPELASKIEFNDLDLIKLFYITNIILQPVRDIFGPVLVLSGKRSEELNKAVGGAKESLHLMRGYDCAVDFTTPNANMQDVFTHLKGTRWGSFGELIYYPKQNFIHVSLPNESKISRAWVA